MDGTAAVNALGHKIGWLGILGSTSTRGWTRIGLPDVELASRLAEYQAHLFRRVRDAANPSDCKPDASGNARFDSVILHQFPRPAG